MAAQDSHGTGGSMDLTDHMRTWTGFTGLVKWSIGSIFIIMALLAIFRTHN
jgi:hypothetical protein